MAVSPPRGEGVIFYPPPPPPPHLYVRGLKGVAFIELPLPQITLEDFVNDINIENLW